MSQSNQSQYNNGPVYFVDAKVTEPKKEGSNKYIWSKTFDLNEVQSTLGTNVVTLKVVVPKKRDDGEEDKRLLVLSGSDAKYLPKKKQNGENQAAPRPQRTGDDDIVL